MAKEGAAMTTPPNLSQNEQFSAASDFDMERMRSMRASDESFEGDLQKGDITSERTKSTRQTKVPENEQDNISVSISAARQRQDQIRKAKIKLAKKGEAGALGGGKLFTGATGLAIRNIPGISMLMNRFKTASLAGKIKILEQVRRLLGLAKTGAAIFDAIKRWLIIFTPSTVTIVLAIFMVIALIPWVTFCAIFKIGPTARKFSKATKQISQTLTALKKQYQQEQQRRAALASLSQAEMSAANEQAQIAT